MSVDKVVKVTSANWDEEVVNAPVPVLVDFWAPWCVPCKTIEITLNELAAELNGALKICSVNVGQDSQLAANFYIQALPTLLVFKTGVVQQQVVGAIQKADLKAKLSAYI